MLFATSVSKIKMSEGGRYEPLVLSDIIEELHAMEMELRRLSHSELEARISCFVLIDK